MRTKPNSMRLPVPEYSHLRIATRQETYDAIINDQAHTDAKVWRDSIVTYSPLGDIKREVLTLKIIEQIKQLSNTPNQTWIEPDLKILPVDFSRKASKLGSGFVKFSFNQKLQTKQRPARVPISATMIKPTMPQEKKLILKPQQVLTGFTDSKPTASFVSSAIGRKPTLSLGKSAKAPLNDVKSKTALTQKKQ
jgi:hypothetical protein